ncbi:hypothetical protein [Kribbella ginsengisoli]|uniref:Uncharacterized protein n=1 Tax=Kribbella ginsengisoli TaxID=363865 RepID=A0ABP6WMM8_9ACTN
MNDHTTLEAPVGTEEAKAELKQKIKAQLKEAMGRTGFELKNFIRIVGPLNMGRVISAGAADKEEWIEEIYRHQSIKHTVKTGDLEGGRPVPRQQILDDLTGHMALFTLQNRVLDELTKALRGLSDLELVQDTGHGRGLLIAVGYLSQVRGDTTKWHGKAARLVEAITAEGEQPDPDSDARVAYARYWREAKEIAVDIAGKIATSQQDAQEALEFEAMKAIVTDPDNPKYQTYQDSAKAGLKITDNGMGALETTSDVMADVPEAHVKTASVGLAAAVSVLTVLKVDFDRLVKSSASSLDVAQYKKKENVGAAYIALDKKPMLIAEMLARKRVSDADYVLSKVADPVIRELAPFAPPMVVSTLWEGIRETIVKTVDEHEQKRIEIAKVKLGLKEKEADWSDLTLEESAKRLAGIVGDTGEGMLDDLEETITSNVFTLLNPVELAAGTAIRALAGRIAKIIASAIPATAAQDVDGGKLYGRIEAITGALKRALPQGKATAGPPTCPTTTDEGVRVETVLSRQLTGELNGQPCWLVRLVSGARGHLYAMDRTFIPLPAGDPQADVEIPATDHLGRSFVWIVPDTKPAGNGGMFGRNVHAAFKARIGTVVGKVEKRTKAGTNAAFYFTAENVSDDSYDTWSRRVVFDGVSGEEPGGYYDRDSGDRVEGTWYQPWSGANRYLFVAKDGTCNWAQGGDPVGNRPGTKVHTALAKIRYDSSFNLDSVAF